MTIEINHKLTPFHKSVMEDSVKMVMIALTEHWGKKSTKPFDITIDGKTLAESITESPELQDYMDKKNNIA